MYSSQTLLPPPPTIPQDLPCTHPRSCCPHHQPYPRIYHVLIPDPAAPTTNHTPGFTMYSSQTLLPPLPTVPQDLPCTHPRPCCLHHQPYPRIYHVLIPDPAAPTTNCTPGFTMHPSHPMHPSHHQLTNLNILPPTDQRPAGADPGGGGYWGSGPPPPFGGPPNFIKREKTSRVCAQIRRVLVLNTYLSEILYPPLWPCCPSPPTDQNMYHEHTPNPAAQHHLVIQSVHLPVQDPADHHHLLIWISNTFIRIPHALLPTTMGHPPTFTISDHVVHQHPSNPDIYHIYQWRFQVFKKEGARLCEHFKITV